MKNRSVKLINSKAYAMIGKIDRKKGESLMKKVHQHRQGSGSNRTLFTGNRSKRNGLYIRYYSGRTGNR